MTAGNIITAVLTVLGGVFVYVAGQIIAKFFIDPYQEYRKTVGEIAHALVYYGHVSANTKKELQDEASTAFRDKAALLRARAYEIPLYKWFTRVLRKRIPPFDSVIAASNALIGLSNSVHGNDHDGMERYRKTIIDSLRLPTPH